MKRTLSLLAIVTALPALAEGTRELDAHEHGVGTLNIAIENTTVSMEFEAPGADIVGFEYAAKSEADISAVNTALATLSSPLQLFVVPDSALCSIVDAHAALESGEEHEDHADEHGHEEHADDEHTHDHGHEDHEKHDDAEHEEHEHEEHDSDHHDGHAEHAAHSEFHANYVLDCANPEALSDITFAYFTAFQQAQSVDVQVIRSTGAQAYQVDRNAPVLNLEP
ncbi:zinc uptake protein ZrgA [Phaeobacter gallaeciensis]|uniref:ABC-type Zn2+ transport system, periplasmic component/surface adhesin n=1 Tax=Phaeobacter gallaeciensis TaxID=60890 RepID=A0AAD0EEU0_9RHOB|nr:DUF2796 domain-containing protein [Phaeobacter gallaeciensis]AHD11631.1 ABC-type Zn2+ transport system, periplasmic component/surface adhesin [Phaeobacter gallaeciensis DSM 26640]ATE94895.1 ABC-type Zn2+ transport system, periplasmic component/surface adhesin [Phaeobacter gallaeciensis]ATE99166.1 ABC-type Zn2+ transport system, periplasmic component/surface adhesin [Phaeobacter gallaeciensis]ATF03559.1 ABC-type Zn2+ transport system, periplasmic component/surface adhesin [Phaeobacter gallaec